MVISIVMEMLVVAVIRLRGHKQWQGDAVVVGGGGGGGCSGGGGVIILSDFALQI